jgi:hypothetical protein
MGVVIEICAKYPGGRTRKTVTEICAVPIPGTGRLTVTNSYSTVLYNIITAGP